MGAKWVSFHVEGPTLDPAERELEEVLRRTSSPEYDNAQSSVKDKKPRTTKKVNKREQLVAA